MSWKGSSTLSDSALWGTAAAVALVAHMGGALWIMQHAEAATPPGLPEPVFVELAPMPEAAAPPDEAEAPELAEAAPEPEPEPEPELAMPPLEELEPLADMNSLFPPPPDAVVLQKPERPPERPEPEPEPEPKVVEKRHEPKKRERKERAPEEQPARQATTQIRAPQSDRTAAPQGQVGTPSPRQVASWQSKVQSAVARHMQRARLSGGRGTMNVTVSFSIDPSGHVAGARLASSTGDSKIDAALNRQVSRMPRLPAPPSGKTIALTVPVKIISR